MREDLRSDGYFHSKNWSPGAEIQCMNAQCYHLAIINKNLFDGDVRHWRSTVVLEMTEISVIGGESVKQEMLCFSYINLYFYASYILHVLLLITCVNYL